MSDLRIDREGKWFYGEREMSRQDIVALFYRHLIMDEFGSFFVEIREQSYPVEIEETAYVIWAVYARGAAGTADGRTYLLLSDDSVEELDVATLRIGENNVPYCKVKNGGFDARFATSSYYQLAELVQYDESRDRYFLLVKGQIYYIEGKP